MGLAEGTEQATGDGEGLAREELGDGDGDLWGELDGAGVDGLDEDEEADGLVLARPCAVNEGGAVLAHRALDDRVAADPNAHAPRVCFDRGEQAVRASVGGDFRPVDLLFGRRRAFAGSLLRCNGLECARVRRDASGRTRITYGIRVTE